MHTRTLIGMITLCLTAGLCPAQDATNQDADFQARLKAGREAAYKKYLLLPTVTDADRVTMPAPAPVAAQPVQARVTMPAQSLGGFGTNREAPYAYGDLRQQFYDNPNPARTQRFTDYEGAPYIFQPAWDSRYNRSWPRPVVLREYVKGHMAWDGQRYTYVPGRTEYRTEWYTQGWPRYRWNGSHYSVSVSYNR